MVELGRKRPLLPSRVGVRAEPFAAAAVHHPSHRHSRPPSPSPGDPSPTDDDGAAGGGVAAAAMDVVEVAHKIADADAEDDVVGVGVAGVDEVACRRTKDELEKVHHRQNP